MLNYAFIFIYRYHHTMSYVKNLYSYHLQHHYYHRRHHDHHHHHHHQYIDSFRERAKKSAIDVMNIHVLTPNPAYSRADGVNISKEAHAVTTKTLVVLETKLNKVSSDIIVMYE